MATGRRVCASAGSWSPGLALSLATLLVLLLLAPQGTLGQAAPNLQVKVLVLQLTDLPIPSYYVDSLNYGFEAALTARNFNVADGVGVTLIKRSATMKTAGDEVEAALQSNSDILLLAIPIGDTAVSSYLPVLEKHDLVSFAPFTGSSLVRGWNPLMYFVRPEPSAELLALLRYAVSCLRVRRLGFMYLQGLSFGDKEYEQAERVMSHMGYKLCGVFTVKSSFTGGADDAVFNAEWEKFADTLPQAVIVFGSPVSDTTRFVKRMLTDKRTADAYLLAPSGLQDNVLSAWYDAVTNVAQLRPGQVITSGTNPLAKDTQHEGIKRFQSDMNAYLANLNPPSSGVGANFPNNDNEGEIMVAGWIAGEVLARALSNRDWVKDRQAFSASLLKQRRYLIDDIVIGDYGGPCEGMAESQGAICQCNQGGRTVYIKRFLNDYEAVPVADGTLTFNGGQCSASEDTLVAPLLAVSVLMNDNGNAVTAFNGILLGAKSAIRESNMFGFAEMSLSGLLSTVTGASNALASEVKTRRVHAVTGVVTEEMLGEDDTTFLDPLYLEPRLHKFQRHAIHLQPTLEQQLFVLAQFLGSSGKRSIRTVIRSKEAKGIQDVMRRSLTTFGNSLQGMTRIGDGNSLENQLPSSGDVFVIGLIASDARVIAKHLAAYTGVRVLVPFSEMALLYSDFASEFSAVTRSSGGSKASDRLVFTTNLPHWNDDSTTSQTAQLFNSALPDPTQRTPLAMMGFAAARVGLTVRSWMAYMSAKLFADFFYRNVAVAVDDMLYGHFSDGEDCDDDNSDCSVNYGATRMSVWSFSRVLDPAVPALFPATTPSMKYAHSDKGLTTPEIIGIVVGVLLFLLLLLALLLFLFCRRRNSRINANAPKNPMEPVTLVFTDIQSSTALWSSCPELMPAAVAAHHRLIRSLIKRHHCYEVKTLGDSFMIASKNAFAAVQLAREMQQVFLNHDWETSEIDDAYHKIEEDRAAEDDEYVPPTARLDAAVYEQYWNGLRVRVGVHTGPCDIRRDEVTKRYDYYGETPNMAARTESVANGGQVLLTCDTYMALTTAEQEQVEVTSLGPVLLRGLTEPVEMYQLEAVPGRTFAPLRLDKVPNLEEVGDVGGNSGKSAQTARAEIVNTILSVLDVLFGTLPTLQRHKRLVPVCQHWSVRVPQKTASVTLDDACRVAIERLAEKLSQMMKHKGSVDGDNPFLPTVGLTTFGLNETGPSTENKGWGFRSSVQLLGASFTKMRRRSHSVIFDEVPFQKAGAPAEDKTNEDNTQKEL